MHPSDFLPALQAHTTGLAGPLSSMHEPYGYCMSLAGKLPYSEMTRWTFSKEQWRAFLTWARRKRLLLQSPSPSGAGVNLMPHETALNACPLTVHSMVLSASQVCDHESHGLCQCALSRAWTQQQEAELKTSHTESITLSVECICVAWHVSSVRHAVGRQMERDAVHPSAAERAPQQRQTVRIASLMHQHCLLAQTLQVRTIADSSTFKLATIHYHPLPVSRQLQKHTWVCCAVFLKKSFVCLHADEARHESTAGMPQATGSAPAEDEAGASAGVKAVSVFSMLGRQRGCM